VNIPNAPNLDVGNQVTIAFLMKGDISNPMDTCCQGLVTTDFYGVEISGGHDPRVGVNFFINTDPTGNSASFRHTSNLAGGGFSVAPGDWHHVAGVYDGFSMKLYVDGQLQAETPQVGNITPMRSTSFLAIGSEDGRTKEPFVIGTRYWLFRCLISASIHVHFRPILYESSLGAMGYRLAKCKNFASKAIGPYYPSTCTRAAFAWGSQKVMSIAR
jgi:Concanavalin A-like lectin/glucanases superfamily